MEGSDKEESIKFKASLGYILKQSLKKKREEEGNGSGGRGKRDKRKRNHRKGVIVNLILEAPRRYSLA